MSLKETSGNLSSSLSLKNGTSLLFIFFAVLVALLRVAYCLELPANTGDVLRHAHYGLLVNEQGLGAADLPLAQADERFEDICWSDKPFNYPVLALLFDALIMALFPTLFGLKLALTLLEAMSALLIFKHTKEKFLSLIYWASPISIWWVSHEGQFESLQNFFLIGAIYFLSRKKWLSWLLLAFAIQSKFFAVFMLPFFILSEADVKTLTRHLAFFALGFVPTIIAGFYYSPMANFKHSASLVYNPYYWNVIAFKIFGWNPPWLIMCNQISTWAAIALFIILLVRHQNKKQYVGPLGFLVGIKFFTNVQFWYMTTMTTMLLPMENRRLRF